MKVQWILKEVDTDNVIAFKEPFEFDFEGMIKEIEDLMLFGNDPTCKEEAHGVSPIGILGNLKKIK